MKNQQLVVDSRKTFNNFFSFFSCSKLGMFSPNCKHIDQWKKIHSSHLTTQHRLYSNVIHAKLVPASCYTGTISPWLVPLFEVI